MKTLSYVITCVGILIAIFGFSTFIDNPSETAAIYLVIGGVLTAVVGMALKTAADAIQKTAVAPMSNYIFGGISIVWGGAILLYGFLKGGPQGYGAIFAGQAVGLLFGALMFVVGLYAVFRKGRDGRA